MQKFINGKDMKILNIYLLVQQFIKFGIVGLSSTAISFGVYYIFILVDKRLYLIGNIVGFVISLFNSYYWNNKYVFKKQNNFLKTIIKLCICYGSTFLLGILILYISVNTLCVSEFIAPILVLMVNIPLNFLLNKFWTFK